MSRSDISPKSGKVHGNNGNDDNFMSTHGNKNIINAGQKLRKQKNIVVYLSSLILDAPSCNILEKGLNFAILPRKIPFEELISNIEYDIKNLSHDCAEEIT